MGWAWEGVDKEVTCHWGHPGASGIGEGAVGGREVVPGGDCGEKNFWRAPRDLLESVWRSSKDLLEN